MRKGVDASISEEEGIDNWSNKENDGTRGGDSEEVLGQRMRHWIDLLKDFLVEIRTAEGGGDE